MFVTRDDLEPRALENLRRHRARNNRILASMVVVFTVVLAAFAHFLYDRTTALLVSACVAFATMSAYNIYRIDQEPGAARLAAVFAAAFAFYAGVSLLAGRRSAESQAGAPGREACLARAQEEILRQYAPRLSGRVALVDPAHHSNAGDSLIAYGEIALLNRLGLPFEECRFERGGQAAAHVPRCDWARFDVALLQGGGNWGDLYPEVQQPRLAEMGRMPRVVGAPQSLHYESAENKRRDAAALAAAACPKALGWRQRDSLAEARRLYPGSEHFLSPDLAFMAGPIRNTRDFTREDRPTVDVLFLLRRDRESRLGDRAGLEAAMRGRSFAVADWGDEDGYYRENPGAADVLQRFEHGGLFDYEARFRRVVAMLATGRVLVTDRLHGSILAYLMGIPHVLLDNSYGKVRKTRDVALQGPCRDPAGARADSLAAAAAKSLALL